MPHFSTQLNELNSKTIFKYIKNISNANDAIPVGDTPVYYKVTGSTNNPFEAANAHIFVIPNSRESQYYTQIAFAAYRDMFYIRTATNQNTYSEWKEFSDDATLQTNTEGYMFSASGEYLEDCNTITRPGLCKKVIKPIMPNSPGFYAYILVLLYKGGGMTNITQVAFPYNSKDAIKCRYSFNGEWSEWF